MKKKKKKSLQILNHFAFDKFLWKKNERNYDKYSYSFL